MTTTPEILAKIKSDCVASWPGPTGESRAANVLALLDRMLPEYAAALGRTQDDVLAIIEEFRDLNAVNYYQEANFPKLDGVRVFESPEAFALAFPSRTFICPACEGISTNPYTCNAGTVRDDKTCNWKSYGLLGTMGKGLRAVVKSTFLESPRVHEIFMPVEAAAKESA